MHLIFLKNKEKMEVVSKIAINWFKFHVLKNEEIFINNYKNKTNTISSF